ncbi:MAG: sigma-70 family RNA polymerase sigma factor [Planctomycetota bacterium]|nr:sigma-70 family RNA polymerase sigma factor [Planctomycetota bacterium]
MMVHNASAREMMIRPVVVLPVTSFPARGDLPTVVVQSIVVLPIMQGDSTDKTPASLPKERVFATTQWSLVVAASHPDSAEDSRLALETLCERYWYPLYAYVRRRGFQPEESSDLTQAFFASMLEKNTIEKADPNRGRFRTFLLTSLKNFISNHWRSHQAIKRGGQLKKISLDLARGEEQYALEPVDLATAENLYSRRWAMTLLATTLEKLRNEYSRNNRLEQFNRTQPYLVGDQEKVPYREVAETLGITENAVKVSVHRMRKRFGVLLREEISQTVSSEEAVEEELREMFQALGNG